MLRRKVVTCDVCGKDITAEDIRYKFKEYENSYTNYDDFEHLKWNRMDMCSDCYDEFLKFAHNKIRFQITGAENFAYFCRVCDRQNSSKCNLCKQETRSGFDFSPYKFMKLIKEMQNDDNN